MSHNNLKHSQSRTIGVRSRSLYINRLREDLGELGVVRFEKHIALATLEKLIWEHEDQSIKLAALEYWFKLVGEEQHVNS